MGKQYQPEGTLTVMDVARLLGVSDVFVYSKMALLPPREQYHGPRYYWREHQLAEITLKLFEKHRRPSKCKRVRRRPRTLDADQERELLSLRRCGFTQRELAKMFNLSQGHISTILSWLEAEASQSGG